MNNTGLGNKSETTYVLVRGVNILASQVKEYEDAYEAKLVPDADWRLVAALDRAYHNYRMSHDGQPPDRVTIAAIDPFVEFIPHIIQVQEPVTQAMVRVTHKPAWFKRKRRILTARG